MSIFPDDTRRIPAEHDRAEPRAIASPEGANAQGAGAGAAASAANSTEHKLHGFDKFALRLAAGMITAIRVTLDVFASPDKERWPFARLLDHLRGAESLDREMLREIAGEISITPAKLRERRKQEMLVSGDQSRDPKSYFRLGVSPLSRASADTGSNRNAPLAAPDGAAPAGKIAQARYPNYTYSHDKTTHRNDLGPCLPLVLAGASAIESGDGACPGGRD